MKKVGFIVAGLILALSLVGCSHKEGKSGLLTLKGKQAFEFDMMYKKFPYNCKPNVLNLQDKTYKNMSNSCKKAYADFATDIQNKLNIYNVQPQDISDAYSHILKESNQYANTHISEVIAAEKS
jgi:hypothetical protein